MYIYIYIIYIANIPIDPAGILSFVPSSVIVALHLPMLELLALTLPIVDICFGTGLMKMFLWTVGSFYVLGEQWDLTLFSRVRFHFLRKHRYPCLLFGGL